MSIDNLLLSFLNSHDLADPFKVAQSPLPILRTREIPNPQLDNLRSVGDSLRTCTTHLTMRAQIAATTSTSDSATNLASCLVLIAFVFRSGFTFAATAIFSTSARFANSTNGLP